MAEMTICLPPPSPKQEQFLSDTHKFVSFGGARGGGKSWAVRVKAILLCCAYQGIKVMIVRKSFPELEANHILPIREMLPKAVYRYNDTKKRLFFQNGSQIIFKYCASEKDTETFQGLETDALFLDEATNFTESQFKRMIACVRGVNNFPKRVYCTCNPGGVGHQWVKRLFIDRRFVEGEDPSDYGFIQSLVTDNKILLEQQPDYVKQLESLPPALKEAWLNGNWDIFEGAYFEEFRTSPDPKMCMEAGITVEEALALHKYTHVIEPFEIPQRWQIYRSFDWGYGKPYSVGYHALAEDNTAYRIAEIYGWNGRADEGCRETNKEICDRIVEFERQHPLLQGKKIRGVADPSCWTRNGSISFAEEAEKHSLWFEKADNERIPGWMQLRERLRFDEKGQAKLYIFNTCKAIIRCLPLMMYDEHYVEDLDSSLEDHCCDELRYFCQCRPIPARNIERKTYYAVDPLNQFNKPLGGYFGG
jgi:phage terminase large subunit